jgi:hypothetical protein
MQVDREDLVRQIRALASSPDDLAAMTSAVRRDRSHWLWTWQAVSLGIELRHFVAEGDFHRDPTSYIPEYMLEFERRRAASRGEEGGGTGSGAAAGDSERSHRLGVALSMALRSLSRLCVLPVALAVLACGDPAPAGPASESVPDPPFIDDAASSENDRAAKASGATTQELIANRPATPAQPSKRSIFNEDPGKLGSSRDRATESDPNSHLLPNGGQVKLEGRRRRVWEAVVRDAATVVARPALAGSSR